MVRRAPLVVLVVVGLLGGTLGGAASAATVSPSEFAPRFCSALATYQDALDRGSDELQSSLEGVTNLEKARAKLVAFLGKMSAAAKKAKGAVQDAGAPSSANGSEIADQFVTALDDSSARFAKAKAQAAKVSTSSPAAFQKQGAKVATDLGNAAIRLSTTFDDLATLDRDGELVGAFQADSSCSNLYESA